MSSQLDDTVEYLPVATFADTFFADAPFILSIDFGAATHPGNVRQNNEDQYAVVKRSRSTEMLLTSLAPHECPLCAESAYTLVVADGIGGAKSGDVASRVTLQAMLELAGQATSWVMRIEDLEAQQVRERIDAYLRRIQSSLRDVTRADPHLSGMGTTWTSVHLFPGRAVVVHVGDSRAYLAHQGRLAQITHDETIAQKMIDSGMRSDMVSRFRHLLTNSLGAHHDKVTAQIHEVEFGPGDQLLLCTDGLTEVLADEAIADALRQPRTPQATCDALIRQALDAGGVDNVTVVLARAV